MYSLSVVVGSAAGLASSFSMKVTTNSFSSGVVIASHSMEMVESLLGSRIGALRCDGASPAATCRTASRTRPRREDGSISKMFCDGAPSGVSRKRRTGPW